MAFLARRSAERPRLLVEELEPRILYSADAAALLGLAGGAPSAQVREFEAPAWNPTTPSSQNQATNAREIIFIDSRVPDADKLADELMAQRSGSNTFDVVIIDAEEDGVAQISRALAHEQNLAAIHIISHGSEGAIEIGNGRLDSERLAVDEQAVARWGQSLAAGGDLLLYGCEVARGSAGESFVRSLASLTGADVAASSDRTGSVSIGGNWTLEYATGTVHSRLTASSFERLDWSGLLVTYTVTSTADTAVAGTLRWAITQANASVGVADTIDFNIAGTGIHTINIGSALPTISDKVTFDATTDDSFAANGSRPAIILDGNDLAGNGLTLGANADGSTIRGMVIRDFSGSGISIVAGSDNNLIVGNYVGRLTATGTDAGAAEANGDRGIEVFGAGNTIGGLTAADRNVVAGNTNDGIALDGASAHDNLVLGNFVGINANGVATIVNGAQGVYIGSGAANNTVGGTVAGAANVIGGSAFAGVEINGAGSTGNKVQGNFIGTDVGGTLNLANGNNGVYLVNGASGNLIGGTVAGAGNTVAFNIDRGVVAAGNTTLGNALLGNTIHSNGSIGIDLGWNGITANDATVNMDSDSGPNGLQNFPVLTSANSNASGTTIVGTINSNANTTLRIEFYGNRPTIADTPNGEGERYLGFMTVTTDGAGNASVNTTLSNVWVNSGDRITATATVQTAGPTYGSTSEFAANIAVTSTGIVVVDTASDTYDAGVASGSVTIATLGASRGADGRISLREALYAVNNTANVGTPDKIVFNIAGTGVHSINLGSILPSISGAVIIDASTDDSFAAQANRPAIALNGGGTIQDGLQLYGAASGGSTVRGLIIQNFTQDGVDIATSNGNTIAGNWIGLNTAGTGAAGNQQGVNIYNANNNLIGGSTIADRNVISANSGAGIYVDTNNGSSTGNLIRGNYIGTDAAGSAAVGNGINGVFINAANNTVGGTSVGQGNVISGTTTASGLQLGTPASGSLIAGNLIGLNAAGTAAIGNAGAGIYVFSGSNTFGGITASARNVIAGNGKQGVMFDGASASSNVVIGNYIGTDATGMFDLNGAVSDTVQTGLVMYNGSSHNRIGTDANGSNDAAERNIISGNNWFGVEFIGSGTTGNVVQGNYIGTDATGLAPIGNAGGGVSFWDSASSNQLGSGLTGAGNVVSGNAAMGVLLANGSINNKVQGNTIGLGATLSAVTGNVIGTDNNGSNDAGERNVISGNANGVVLSDLQISNNTVAGNYIGTDATGLLARANTGDGIRIENGANANLIGGSSTAQRNVVSGNGQDGIQVDGEASDNNLVRGNWVGVNAAGTAPLGNGGDGIFINAGADNTAIGGTGANEGNWLAGNSFVGIELDGASSGTSILGNRIGTDLAGTANWGHQQSSILLENGATGTTIGGTSLAAANVIAFSGQGGTYTAGIEVLGSATTGNAFLQNAIYSNVGPGIDLNQDGVTANDAGDFDSGANNLQNFPVLTSAITDGAGKLGVQGTLESSANSYYRLDFFASASADASGYGEGQTYLGFFNVTTDGSGNASFVAPLNASVALGAAVSATATNSNAAFNAFTDTSEFALSVTASQPVAPINTVPAPQSTNEDTSKVFSAANGNAISISDADAGGANNQITVSVTNGTLTFASVSGLTFTLGDGTADATMTLRGTAAAINTALNGLSFNPTANYNGGAVLTLATKDSVLLSLDIDTGLLGRYAFESTGNPGLDSSTASGNNAATVGVTELVDGARGKVISLDGSSNSNLQISGRFGNPGDVTLAAWVNLSAVDSAGAVIFSLGDSVSLTVNALGQPRGFYYNGSVFTATTYNTNLIGAGWHHLAFAFSDSGISSTLYLDGIAVGSQAVADSISYTLGTNSTIGTHANGSTSWDLNGKIDDARIYNRALTANEI
ncbi:MAG: DUF4347 domain-containing protein, partial [Ideonella sp.]